MNVQTEKIVGINVYNGWKGVGGGVLSKRNDVTNGETVLF